jgi:hypothetical protein
MRRGAGPGRAGPGRGGRECSWAQVWDVPPIVLERVHSLLPRRRCGCCGKVTTAVPPFGQAGTVVYGVNVNAAAVLLASEDNVPVQRTAMLMEALPSAPVSAGFVARAHQQFAERSDAAGFDAAMRAALRAELVLCGDETPVNVARRDVDDAGWPVPGGQHVVTLGTPDERLAWYAAVGSRSRKAIKGLGSWTAMAVTCTMPAEAIGSRPASSRTRSRNASCRRFRLPSAHHCRKYQNTACHGVLLGQQPPGATGAHEVRIALTMSRPGASPDGRSRRRRQRLHQPPSLVRQVGVIPARRRGGRPPLQEGRRSATIRLALPPARPLPEERKLATKPQRRDRAA